MELKLDYHSIHKFLNIVMIAVKIPVNVFTPFLLILGAVTYILNRKRIYRQLNISVKLFIEKSNYKIPIFVIYILIVSLNL